MYNHAISTLYQPPALLPQFSIYYISVKQVICLPTCNTLLVLWYFCGFVCFFGFITLTLLLLCAYSSLTLPLIYSLLIIVQYLVSRCQADYLVVFTASVFLISTQSHSHSDMNDYLTGMYCG